eukprot:2664332-Rhodomonas_salina.1
MCGQRMLLRACHAMSRTAIAYAATYALYAMPGTVVDARYWGAYAATRTFVVGILRPIQELHCLATKIEALQG